jgi:hypothetical protein
MNAKTKRLRRVREGGRAKTSARWVAAPFGSASPCAGFEPCPSIHLVMKVFEFRESRLAMANRILVVGFAVAKTGGGCS